MFEWFNEFVRFCYRTNFDQFLYQINTIVPIVFQMLYFWLYYKKYKVTPLKGVLSILLTYSCGYFMMLLFTWIENGFKNWGDNNIVRIYVWIPLFAFLWAKLFKADVRDYCDVGAPAMALQQGVSHWVCSVKGCCYGYPCSWGIWNPWREEYLFPVQWLESICALGVFFFLIWYAKKKNYKTHGTIYPIMLLLFGGTRLGCEYLRDSPKYFLGISQLGFHCVFMMFVGAVWLILENRHYKKYVLQNGEQENSPETVSA